MMADDVEVVTGANFKEYVDKKLGVWNESDHPRDASGKFTDIAWSGKAKENVEKALHFFSSQGHKVYDQETSSKTHAIAMYSPSNDRFYINPKSEWAKNPADYAKRMFESGHLSTDHPMGILHHEMAHKLFDAPDNFHDNTRDRGIAERVSKYARSNPKEFVSETYAGVTTGKKYDEEVMNMYKRYSKKRDT